MLVASRGGQIDVARRRLNHVHARDRAQQIAEILRRRGLQHVLAQNRHRRRRVDELCLNYLCAAGDEGAILARFKQFADAGVTDLSVRLLPIGDNREELIASKYRTREVIADLAKAVR